MERFLERDHDVGFHIAPSLGASRPLSKTAAAKTTAPSAAAKELFEEIAEPGPAELEFHATAITSGVAAESTARLLPAPSRRRLKPARLVPIRSQLVVFPALLGVAQDLIRFVELLEFFFRDRLVLVDVGMVFARQFAERLFDLVVGRSFGNA